MLPQGRTIYYGFRDRYAPLLLEYAIGEAGCSIADLKTSALAPLLQKSCVKSVLANLGSAWLRPTDLINAWPEEPYGYRLTLGTWPGLDSKPHTTWNQITRWGWNIVLQLNLATSHRRELGKLVSDWEEVIEDPVHPIAGGGELTLAWSRIDLDLETGEALIEEIQSDWVRDVKYYAQSRWVDNREAWEQYFEQFLKPQTRKWPETMLTATLWFLLKELGIRRVFYHTPDSGKELKRIGGVAPPRSIYSDLPRRFCFQVTHSGPLFIRDSAKRELRKRFAEPRTQWQVLDLNRRPPQS